eukprot:jgi/Hompol1/4188/HPOL_007003-RA
MRFFEATTSFSHSWPLLTFANWRKYPNEHAPHVLSVDVLSRRVNPETGVLETERLLRCKQTVPGVLRALGFNIPEEAYFLETSTLDPETQTYVAKSINLSLRSLFTAEETCVFKPDPLKPSELTCFSQRMEIATVGALSMFSRLIEDAAVSRFQANAARGRQGLESVVQALLAQSESSASSLCNGLSSQFGQS